MSSFEYWCSSFEEILDSAGCYDALTREQIDEVAKGLCTAAELDSQYCGYDQIPNPLVTEIENLKSKHKKELDELENKEYNWRKAYAKKINRSSQDISINEYGQIEIWR